LHRKKRLLAKPFARELIALTRAASAAAGENGAGPATADADAAEAFLNSVPAEELAPPPLLTGADLIAAGLTPGPEFKRLLDAAYDAQLDGLISTSAEALAFVDADRPL
ncbi:MAG: hypothetical protein AAF907_10060, partial [Planctomycetota bacterium]